MSGCSYLLNRPGQVTLLQGSCHCTLPNLNQTANTDVIRYMPCRWAATNQPFNKHLIASACAAGNLKRTCRPDSADLSRHPQHTSLMHSKMLPVLAYGNLQAFHLLKARQATKREAGHEAACKRFIFKPSLVKFKISALQWTLLHGDTT